MFSITWLKDALERAIKTFAQVLLSVLTLDGANVMSLDWGQTFSAAGTATAISVLTSILSAGLGSAGTASMTNAVEPAPVASEVTDHNGTVS
jgi:hypothetical protein